MVIRRPIKLPRPALVLVTDSRRPHDRRPQGEEWVDDIVREAVLGGVNIVQLREKHLPRGELIALGLHVRDAIARRALFFVNGDIHAAVALAADGLHLPEDGPSIEDARRLVGDEMLISRAVHSVDGAIRAHRDGTDLVQLGTVFETSSKPHADPIGLEGVREVCNAVLVPVIAIGGINQRNAPEVMRGGAAGVATIGAIFDAGDPRSAAGDLLRAVSGTSATR
jgi:thiamine-phosphate pyrophosphorylase